MMKFWKCAVVVVVIAVITGISIMLYDKSNGYDISLNEMSTQLQEWEQDGRYITVYNHSMFVNVQRADSTNVNDPDIILMHGFPTSSFDFRKPCELLVKSSKFSRIIAFDHVGFGFSDKPESYSYSLYEQAEHVIDLLRQLDVKRAHLLAHDMGDSILTELLARIERNQLPSFGLTVESVTFTNGGMLVEQINFRLSQSLLLSPWIGPAFHSLVQLDRHGFIFRKQMATLWGKKVSVDYDEIYMNWQLMLYKNGQQRLLKTIQYINDRYKFQTRWLTSLNSLDIPVHVLWSDSDSVSPLSIGRGVYDLIADKTKKSKLSIMEGYGHFFMVEDPTEWTKSVLSFIHHL